MIWFLVAQIFSTLISLIQIGRLSEKDKDLEIMVLRYQLGIAERKMQKPVRANRAERMTLAILAARLKKQTNRPASQFRQVIRLFQQETVFRWHRDLVRRKLTQEYLGKRGRPRIDDQVESLIIRLTKENLRSYIEYYNTRRPHQSLEQQSAIPYPKAPGRRAVKKRLLLGGILNDYFRAPGNNAISPQLS
ncbi:MAG: hypothetical protein JSV68_03385 [Anaerolineaceae bacterium]|nr:MAG: hypothetical protein JSV68_03385 [Anaerolineaceae bacterium]